MKLKNLLEMSLMFGKKNLPEILAVVSTVGVVTTGILAFRAGRKADEIIKEKKRDMEDVDPEDSAAKKEVIWETIKEVSPIVAPPIILGAVTIASIVGSNRVSNKRIVALSAAYSLSESTLKDFKKKMVEVVGENRATDIKDEVAKEKLKRAEEKGDVLIVTPPEGKIRCMDGFVGTVFYSTYQRIQQAINELTSQCFCEQYVSISDLYDILGVPSQKVCDFLQFKDDDFYGKENPFHLTSTLSSDGVPTLVINYEPKCVSY